MKNAAAQTSLAVMYQEGRHARGSRLHAGSELLGINPRQVLAWAFNIALLLTGLAWLVVLLHALQQSDEEQEQPHGTDGAWTAIRPNEAPE